MEDYMELVQSSTVDPHLACSPVKEYFVQETGSCMLCSKHCNGCLGPAATDCLKCHNYMFFDRCVSVCPMGFEPDADILNGQPGAQVKCQMSDSIAALFTISTIALIWFTIVVCCKWRRSQKLLNQHHQSVSSSIPLREVISGSSTAGLDTKFGASESSLTRSLTDRNTMLNRLPSSNSLSRADKMLVSPSSSSDRQTPPRTLYGGTSLQL
ncbi:uncharacterized protein LOC142343909 [Convolutriloba macropyga]|uniref:uncharacterized protein LOC142343909 n=1 Tax=Convolutriloba macropyga TaxID=536237 RepID=UPI003F521E43